MENQRTSILLSLQRALLGHIPHALRSVTVGYKNIDNTLIIQCYFDGEISDEDKETMSEMHTEVLADFSEDTEVKLEIERLDQPEEMTILDDWVYLRKE